MKLPNLIVLLWAATCGVSFSSGFKAPEPPAGHRAPTAVIWRLTPLGGVAGDHADLLTQTLRTQIGRSGWFRVVAREDMARILSEIEISANDICDNTQTAIEFGRLLAAEKMIIGILGQIGEMYSLTVRVVDVQTGAENAIVERRIRGNPEQLFMLADMTGILLLHDYAAIVHRELGLPPPADLDEPNLPAAPPIPAPAPAPAAAPRPQPSLFPKALFAPPAAPVAAATDSGAALNLSVIPPETKVTVDGTTVASTGRVTVPAGKPLLLVFEAPGYFTQQRTYTLTAGQTLEVRIYMRRRTGRLF